MLILAIETSCDDTGLALVEIEQENSGYFFRPVFNETKHQTAIHRKYGGVVPMLAKKAHIENLEKIFQSNVLKGREIDYVAATTGPGLEPALWTGINKAKEIAKKFQKPLIPVNHLEGHLLSALAEKKDGQLIIQDFNKFFPALFLLVSGGNTMLILASRIGKYEIIGQTRDDAAGEALDKAAKMMGLPYPGGPVIAKLAEKGNPRAFSFPLPMKEKNNLDFSFSGLKTSLLYIIEGQPGKMARRKAVERDKKPEIDIKNPLVLANLAASFQEMVIKTLVTKTTNAALKYRPRSVILTGGVAANKLLRQNLGEEIKKLIPAPYFKAVPLPLANDNALMIAIAAFFHCERATTEYDKIKAEPKLSLANADEKRE